jgi:hypothetical protein
MAQRTSLDREMYERLITALLDGDADQRIETAKALAADVPSFWNGSTRHQALARARREAS